jgi:hypothetical protein
VIVTQNDISVTFTVGANNNFLAVAGNTFTRGTYFSIMTNAKNNVLTATISDLIVTHL